MKRFRAVLGAMLVASCCATLANAQDTNTSDQDSDSVLKTLQNSAVRVMSGRMPIIRIETEPVEVQRYADGSTDLRPSFMQFRFMCGSDPAQANMDSLERLAADFLESYVDEPVVVIDRERGGNFNVIFNTDNSVPSAALAALDICEAYLESTFDNVSTVTVSVDYAFLGSGVIGATFSQSLNDSYIDSRNGLQNGMDPDDTIQDWLPTGNTVPVRYNGNSDTVSNESIIFWNRAAYRATVGSVGGTDGFITFNSAFTFDYDPSNGASATSFVDVAIHEVGHAMGFVSKVDDQQPDMDVLDIYRFQRTNGNFDYNPDTLQEFQTTPRLVDFNTPNDQHNSDVISAEYRMSDGNPWQASHFREQFPSFALMDPATGPGETNYPNYFTTADLTMFDAIGYYYPPGCPGPPFTQDPPPALVACAGEFLAIPAQADWAASYQWRFNGFDIDPNDPNYIGANNATLVIPNPSVQLAGTYTCVATDFGGCITESSATTVTIGAIPIATDPEPSQTACAGDDVSFSVSALPGNVTYQWFKGATMLMDAAGEVSGATSSTLTLLGVDAADSTDVDNLYYAVVTNPDGGCSVETATAELTVIDPQFLSDPSDVVATVGDPVSFSATVADENGVSYQWRRNGSPLTDDGRITGATTAMLSIDPVELADAGSYDLAIFYPAGCPTTSAPATLTVNEPVDCEADLTGDNVIDSADLNILLSQFGSPCVSPPDCDGADFTNDGNVDSGDLNVLLTAFGPCP